MNSIIENCHIWHDTSPRGGAMNMAIDQLLVEYLSDIPVLRFYSWNEPTITFGYFGSLNKAQAHFPGNDLSYIRRWTGGGIVDHRADLTYTLILPPDHPWSNLRGSESYRLIHQAAAKALNATGINCQLTGNNKLECVPHRGPCFTNPVEYDIVDPNGQKLAGAGQKRSRRKLLHQGSIIGIQDTKAWKEEFTKQLTHSSILWSPEVSFSSEVRFYELAAELAEQRYASPEWNAKRP